MTYEVNEIILLSAFRYALGRQTYASFEVAGYIQENWEALSEKTQKLIQKEIQEAIELDRAGAEMDKRQWEKILKLKVSPNGGFMTPAKKGEK